MPMPERVYHGTMKIHINSILKEGLLPGGHSKDRRHIHFSPYRPGDALCTAGMRFDSEVLFEIDTAKVSELGIKLYQGTAGAILTPSPIPPTCFTRLTATDTRIVLWEPESVVSSAAAGPVPPAVAPRFAKASSSSDKPPLIQPKEEIPSEVKSSASAADPKVKKTSFVVDLSEDEETLEMLRKEEESLPKCSTCAKALLAGAMFCLACNTKIETAEGADSEGEEKEALAVVKDLQSKYGIDVEFVRTKRGATRTLGAEMCKSLRKYDRRALEEGYLGVPHGYPGPFEEKLAKNATFRESLARNGIGADFRHMCETKYSKEMGKAFGKGKRPRPEDDKGGKGSKGGKSSGWASSGWTSGSSWSGAVWSAAAASTWRGSSATSIVVHKALPVVPVATVQHTQTFIYILSCFVALLAVLAVYETVKHCISKVYKWYTEPITDDDHEVTRFYISPHGECYHWKRNCYGLRNVQSDRITSKRQCKICFLASPFKLKED